SEPTALGALTPDADGTVTVAMPVGLTAGEHRLAAVAADGTVVWDAFDWAAATQAVPAVTTGASQNSAMLGSSGFDGGWLAPAALLALLAGAALLMVRRNRGTITE